MWSVQTSVAPKYLGLDCITYDHPYSEIVYRVSPPKKKKKKKKEKKEEKKAERADFQYPCDLKVPFFFYIIK